MKKTQDKTQKPAVTVEFINNEPIKLIAGGSVRESTLLDHATWPAVAGRERLTAPLFTHRLGSRLEDYLQPEDEELLQRICQETITTGSCQNTRHDSEVGKVDCSELVYTAAIMPLT
jgi:hypothetical protein